MSHAEGRTVLTEETFRLLRELVRDHSGILLDDDSRSIVERRLSGRLRVHNLDNFRDYYRYLLYDGKRDEELSAVMDLLTVNETYFFREKRQLQAFREEILPELREKRRDVRRMRVWSAGCSTGEEAYTIAMLISESGLFEGWDIEVLGSDINRRVLQTARRGVYRRNSFRATSDYHLQKYFEPVPEGCYRVKDDVRRLVTFCYINLLDPGRSGFLGRMDVIFCRNVLIYFDIPSRRKVVQGLYDALNDGGYLLLGHAESLMNITTAFTLRHLKHDLVYQRPEAGVALCQRG